MMSFMLISLFLMSVEVMPSIGNQTQEAVDFSHTITVQDCGKIIRPTNRIAGGKKAKIGENPWMVSIHIIIDEPGLYGSDEEHVCGGSILNENWILTAAHCVLHVNQTWRYIVYAGLHKLSRRRASNTQMIQISRIILHEDYEIGNYESDIALIKTKHPIYIAESQGYVNGICLPTSNEDPTGYAKVTGWGTTYEGGVKSDILRVVRIPIIQREKCNETYDGDSFGGIDKITEKMICAGKAGRDACLGDSGGPLFQTNGTTGVSTIIGVVSYASPMGCNLTNFPGVYTKVSSYKQWIQENVLNPAHL